MDGLEVDRASVSHYTIIADWVAQIHGIPIHREIIKASNNISVAKVSSTCSVINRYYVFVLLIFCEILVIFMRSDQLQWT